MQQPPRVTSWGRRVVAGTIDYGLLTLLALVLTVVQAGQAVAVGPALLWPTALVWALFNGYLSGKTGQSVGKRLVGSSLVSVDTGGPIGGGDGVIRQVLHVMDASVCGIGFLLPLWGQPTFADLLKRTTVIDLPTTPTTAPHPDGASGTGVP